MSSKRPYANIARTLIAMSGQQNVLTVYRPFVLFTGSIEPALMLSQLLYWTPRAVIWAKDKITKKRGLWIAKSDKEFAEELCLSCYGVRLARKTLAGMGFLSYQVKRFNSIPTTHYQLDIDKIEVAWSKWLNSDFAKTQNQTLRNHKIRLCENAKSLTETTTENTTETTTKQSAKNEFEHKNEPDDSGGALFQFICECGIRKKEALKLEQDALKHHYTVEDLQQIWTQAQSRPVEHQTGWFITTVRDGQWKRGKRASPKNSPARRKSLKAE